MYIFYSQKVIISFKILFFLWIALIWQLITSFFSSLQYVFICWKKCCKKAAMKKLRTYLKKNSGCLKMNAKWSMQIARMYILCRFFYLVTEMNSQKICLLRIFWHLKLFEECIEWIECIFWVIDRFEWDIL